ncbi:outer membrane protein [Limimaricola pyoseonensis]|uniref:Lipid A oxidase n=1 Tax=Limimaricola pyoseonensis TaxID=521013 RepID=A0A1G7EX53_9RHOB|nr:outer membrane beta-barrel protein [Limimaricola pyoseonensis]SDE68234.1 lipid A oxidase [Limimaricola pyoseonensis]
MLSRALPLALILAPGLAAAEVELSFYGGVQDAPHSTVEVDRPGVDDDREFTVDWEGNSFDAPPYYGLRATWWREDDLGFGLDFNHAKVYSDDDTLAEQGLETLEFTDGINILTLNAYRRFPDAAYGLTPYVGGGLGLAIPRVEYDDGESRTDEYQITGPAVALMAGASYDITDSVSVFGEYKGTYSANEADLNGGGTLESDIVTNALNLGVSFNF